MEPKDKQVTDLGEYRAKKAIARSPFGPIQKGIVKPQPPKGK